MTGAGPNRRGRLLDLVGVTNLGTLAALIRRAGTLICNDTGVSHVAAALGTPSVVVACGSDVARWAPLKQRHRVLAEPLDCRPCMYEECPLGHACAWAITADQVIEEVREHRSRRDS